MAAIFQHANGWSAKIGYYHTASGKRDRKQFYFTGKPGKNPPADVVTDATIKEREWSGIVADWATLRPKLEESEPDTDWSKPVWFDRALLADEPADADAADVADARKADAEFVATETIGGLAEQLKRGASLESIVTALRAAGALPPSVSAPTRNVTIREAMAEFLEEKKTRIALKVGKKIDTGTYNTTRTNLFLAFGLSTAKNPATPPTPTIIDLGKPLREFNDADAKTIASHWFTLPGGCSPRTAKNYLNAGKEFLAWCVKQRAFGFYPPDVSDWKIIADAAEVTEADFPLLKKILAGHTERTKMFGLLGLLCGFYPNDLAELKQNEVKIIDGETYIVRFRSKEEAENKKKNRVKTTHWIPAEVVALMEKYAAGKNEFGLYFLNEQRKPMNHHNLEGGRKCAVYESWVRATKEIDGAPTFKQLRKWTWNEIQRHAAVKIDNRCVGETLAKRWAGQSGGGVSRSYRFDDYKPVIAAMRAYWKEIKPKLMDGPKKKSAAAV